MIHLSQEALGVSKLQELKGFNQCKDKVDLVLLKAFENCCKSNPVTSKTTLAEVNFKLGLETMWAKIASAVAEIRFTGKVG